MKSNKREQEYGVLVQRFQTMSELVSRLNLASQMGQSYGGDRDLYQALGYPADSELKFDRYYAQYKRHDIAKAIIVRPIKATWRGDVEIIESRDDKETQLEKAWMKLYDDLKLKSKFIRVDKLTGIGKYGILLMGLSDTKKNEDFEKPVKQGINKLLYVKPISEKNAQIHSFVNDPANERYGLPLTYEVTISQPGNSGMTSSIKVHYTRIIHIIDEILESEIEGEPRLEAVFNRLMDLEKLIGGSAEMYWRGARPGYATSLKEGYKITNDVIEDLKNQIDEYEHNLRRILKLEGFDVKELAAQVSDPKSHVDVQIQMISAVTGIPKRILTGSERGELSSSEDKNEWSEWIQSRREEFAESQIIRPFVEWCIKYGILPKPSTETYDIQWSDLFAQSNKDKAEVGRIRAEALSKYVSSPMAESILPPDAFFEFFLGFDSEQIELIKEMVKAMIQEEQQIIKELPIQEPEEIEEEIMEEENV